VQKVRFFSNFFYKNQKNYLAIRAILQTNRKKQTDQPAGIRRKNQAKEEKFGGFCAMNLKAQKPGGGQKKKRRPEKNKERIRDR
jgi:hypothetical protein